MYKYWGFGLHIASEIEFPELLPAEFSEADLTIALGKTPDALQGEVVKKKAFSTIGKDEYLLVMKNICRYYASFGSSLVVEPLDGIDEQSVRLFLLGTVMAAVLYQRGSIPLHASAIVKDGGSSFSRAIQAPVSQRCLPNLLPKATSFLPMMFVYCSKA